MTKKKNQCDEVKRCIICNKPIENEDDMFGGGCLENLYELFLSSIKFLLFLKKTIGISYLPVVLFKSPTPPVFP